MRKLRKLVYIFVISVLSITAMVLFMSGRVQVVLTKSYLVDTEGCKMPKWDPFHETVRWMYDEKKVPYNCEHRTSFLVVRPNATIAVNDTVLRTEYNIQQASSIRCTYKEIIRDPGSTEEPSDDSVYIRKEEMVLTFDSPLTVEFLHARCFYENRLVSDEYLALTPLKRETKAPLEINLTGNKTGPKLNVVILGIDSISKLNFVRHLKKTARFMSKDLRAFEMQGYNKVDDNTFPNIVPLLTGHIYQDIWNETMENFFFDDVDFVWKRFKRAGYTTLFAEDAPEIATFNYQRRGFRQPPADYYFRPFALAVESSEVLKESKKFCFHDRLEMKVLFDYTQSFIDTLGSRPFFAFTFSARLTHDELNNAAFADEPTYDLLQHLHDTNITNNSLVILMSDHGLRFGPLLETYIGRFEERWPFMWLSFPDWFLRSHPEIARNLKVNQNRLTTPFDIHATLVELSQMVAGEDTSNRTFSNSRGISLFSEIPLDRTCEKASISPHWCTCYVQENLAPNDPVVKSAADALMSGLDDALRFNYNVCAELRLDETKHASIQRTTENFLQDSSDSGHVQVSIVVSVQPSGAVFESTMLCHPVTNDCQFKGDVSRLNKYGDDGSCVSRPELRKYCFCKRQLQASS